MFRSKVLKVLAGIFFCSVAFSFGFFICLFHNRWVDFSVLENYNPGKPSIILDDAGEEIGRFEIDRRRLVAINEVPRHLIQSFLVSEDRDFYKHKGVSWKGIFRSTLVNIRHGRIVQGASTITQQLVKLLFFDSRRTFRRKLKEQLVSLLVERQFTKDQILETYLNHVYFGCGIYGVEAASRRFFGKSVGDINVSEAATLAGIVKNPGRYCPLLCPLLSQRRRNLILRMLANEKTISKDECVGFCDRNIDLKSIANSVQAPHLKESVRQFLEKKFGKEKLYRGGLVVKTTINSKVQCAAEIQFAKEFKRLRGELTTKIDGALLSMDTETGEIKAMIGGADFGESKFNRALQARRQMGSVFKPIVYAGALQRGKKFTDVDIDEPIEIDFNGQLWRPQNSTRDFFGEMTLARALSYSNNVITVKTLVDAGCEHIAKLAEKFHLPGPIKPYPSIALGCIDVTLSEAAGAFNVFANGGKYVRPHYIKWVKNEWGSKVWQQGIIEDRVIDSYTSSQVAKVLSIGIGRYLKGKRKRNFLPEVIGKTGTTNDSRTCWFIGATPKLTTAIYLGRDDNGSLGRDIYPVWTAFPIWLGLYERAANKKLKFTYDPMLQEKKVDWVTGRTMRRGDSVSLLV